MSMHAKNLANQKSEEVGRLLARRLHEARKRRGLLRCPVCHEIFEGTYLIKCPGCRTLIGKTFQEVRPPQPAEKMELDFFR